MQIAAQHGFHCQLPTGSDLHVVRQLRRLSETLGLEPLGSTGIGRQGGLLQSLQRGDTAFEPLQFALPLTLFARQHQQFISQLLQAIGDLQLLFSQALQQQFVFRDLLFQHDQALGWAVLTQQGALVE